MSQLEMEKSITINSAKEIRKWGDPYVVGKVLAKK
jgi:hypothetical protein